MSHLTQLLVDASAGKKESLDELYQTVYLELRHIAKKILKPEGPVTLQPTALVNEAYIKLSGNVDHRAAFENRRHFFAAAANAMRQILIDTARKKGTHKRGGATNRLDLDQAEIPLSEVHIDLVNLDEALIKLNEIKPECAQIVTLRYFGGMTLQEIADILDISERTAYNRWSYSKAWLFRELNK